MIFLRYITEYMGQFNRMHREFWNYEDGCIMIGAQTLYEATGDEFYLKSMKNFYKRYIEADGTIRYYDCSEYNLDKVPLARPLFFLHELTGEERYRLAIEIIAEQLRIQPRTKSGNFWHKGIYPNQIWLDGLYMAQPFQVAYENTFGSGERYADMIEQFKNVRTLLFDKEKQLHYHCYDETKTMFWADKETGKSANFWSRAIGWHLMAMVDCYELLPAHCEEEKGVLADLYRETLFGLLKYQDPETGLLYQLTELSEEKGNYLETSASVMLACIIFKGVRLGILDASYGLKGELILISLATNKMSLHNGILSLGDICRGTGLGPEGNLARDGSVAYYLSESTISDEQKGVGALMMAYAEYIKYRDIFGLQPSNPPVVEIYRKFH